MPETDDTTRAEADTNGRPGEVEELLADHEPNYVEQVVTLYEASERNYRAAMIAGHVVNGFTDSTNY